MSETEHERQGEQTEVGPEGPQSPAEPPESPAETPTPGGDDEPQEGAQDDPVHLTEREPVDEEDEGSGDEEPSPPPPPPVTERDIAQAFKKFEAEAARHTKRVEEIAPDLFPGLDVCPLCEPEIPGFVMPPNVDQARVAAVLEKLGITPPRELADDPDSEECPVCRGWGVVKTASHDPAFAELVCRPCSGRGILGPRFDEAPSWQAPSPAQPESNGPPVVPVPDVEPPEAAALRAQGYLVTPLRQPVAPPPV